MKFTVSVAPFSIAEHVGGLDGAGGGLSRRAGRGQRRVTAGDLTVINSSQFFPGVVRR